jgi:type I restriction enzyme S subunit
MSEWKEYLLSEVIDKFIDYRGKTPTKTTHGIPLITAKIVKAGRILEANEFISENDYDSWMTRGLPEVNDVVLTTEAPLGEVALLKDKKVALAQRIITLRGIKEIVDNIFLKYYFQSKDGQHELQSRASGTTVFGIKSSVLQEVPILLPPLAEQKAIAGVLSALDDKIDLLHRQNKTLESMAEALFRQWFVEEAEESWEEGKLGDHSVAFRGLSYKGSGLAEDFSGIPMHNLNSVYEGGGYKVEGIKYYKGEFQERHRVNPGDIIVTNTEQGHEFKLIGFPAIVPDYYGEFGIFSQHIFKLIPNVNSYLTSEYLYYLLMNPEVREQITSATNGSTVNMLSIDGLQRPTFKLPPVEKIEEFTQNCKSFWAKKRNNAVQIRSLEKLRDTLLPKLMTGEVRVEVCEK